MILQKLQEYVVKFYHTYLLCPILDQIEVIIFQPLYWISIRGSGKTKIKGLDNLQHTKLSTQNMSNFLLKNTYKGEIYYNTI